MARAERSRTVAWAALAMCALPLAACAPSGAPASPGADGETAEGDGRPVVGGTVDYGDPAVGMLEIGSGGSIWTCSASLVAPTVMLTAAHCVEGLAGASSIAVYFGTDSAKAKWSDWVGAKAFHIHPGYDPDDYWGGRDFAVVELASPVSTPPLPLNRDPLAKSMIGDPVRLVGYGNSDGKKGTGAGVKRQALTKLVWFDDVLVSDGQAGKTTCQGDSGGPSLMKIGGVEHVVGVTSWGYEGCPGAGYKSRVDTDAAWIDAFLPGGGGGGCTPACEGRTCGDDGCGGTCGSCAAGETCTDAGACESPKQTPKTCDEADGWETEPNDAPADFDGLCKNGKIWGAIDLPDDVDWYGWSIPPDATYEVALSTLPGDYGMTLYKLSGGELSKIATAATKHDGKPQEITRYTSTGGTYYLQVFGYDGAHDPAWGYTVRVTVD